MKNPTLTLSIIQISGCIIAILLMYIYWLQKEKNEAKNISNELLKENAKLIIRLAKLIQPKPGVENFKKANECEVSYELENQQNYKQN